MSDLKDAIAAAKPAKTTAAIGYSITAQLGDRRQIVVQHFVAEDETDEAANACMDRIMGLIDRQQARYDLDAEMEGFHKIGSTLEQTIAGIRVAAVNQKRLTAELAAQIEAMQEARDGLYKEGYDAFNARGGRGTYKPAGALQSRLTAMDGEIEAKKGALAAVPANEAQHKQEVQNSIARFQADLKRRRERVNYLLGLLGKEPNTEYSEQEAFKIE